MVPILTGSAELRDPSLPLVARDDNVKDMASGTGAVGAVHSGAGGSGRGARTELKASLRKPTFGVGKLTADAQR